MRSPRDAARCPEGKGLFLALLPFPQQHFAKHPPLSSAPHMALASSSLTGKEVPAPLPLSSCLQKWIKLEEMKGLSISKPPNHKLEVKRPQRIAHHATTWRR